MARKVHYLPLQFASVGFVYCHRDIKDGTLFIECWDFVTCKHCLKAKRDSDCIARMRFRNYGTKAFEIRE